MRINSARRSLIVLAILCASISNAQESAQAPLSAIDWLSQPAADPLLRALPPISETPTVRTVQTSTIIATPLDAPALDPIGLIAPHLAGLPNNLWANISQDELIAQLSSLPKLQSPAARELFYRILLVRAAPDDMIGDDFVLNRVELLIELGAVDEALALLLDRRLDTPQLFEEFFSQQSVD